MTVGALDWLRPWALKAWTWRTDWPPKPASVTDATDIHVVRGTTSRALRPEVIFWETIGETTWVRFENDVMFATEPNKLESLGFIPRLVIGAGAMVDTGTTFKGFGIEVNKATGAVTALSPKPAGKIVNTFYLDCVAKLTRAANKVDTFTITTRINIHDHITDAWLTPTPLTVHLGSEVRATVLASLTTDGEPPPPLIGDLTHLDGITWSCPDSSVTFGSSGEIRATTLGTFTIKAHLPAGWANMAPVGKITVVEAWAEKPNVRANLVAGPGYARLTEVPNVLILPDGFTPDQEDDWNALVVSAFEDLSKVFSHRPFDLFLTNNSINIWSLFIPSREAGSSALYALTQVKSGATTFGRAIDPAHQPGTGFWQLSELLGQVGYPMRSDARAGDNAAQIAKFKAKLLDWTAMYSPIDAAKVHFDVWQNWADLSTRTLADERDTALGLALGSRPTYWTNVPDRAILYHPLRTDRAALDKLLGLVTDGDGPNIGHVWKPGGKDRNYVEVLVAGARRGGAESDYGVIAASIQDDDSLKLQPIGTGLRCAVIPYALPRSVFGPVGLKADARGTVVHELAHAFGLQDEYTDIERGQNLTGHDMSRTLATVGNVQAIEDLVAPPAIPPAAPVPKVGDGLIGEKLRWRWPRIARAAVLSDFVVAMGPDEFVIPLRRGQKRLFAKGDTVFLRQRPFRWFEVVDKDKATQHTELRIAKTSVPLVVTSDLQVAEQIVVTANGAAFSPNDFTAIPPRESIVFVPVPATPDAAAANEKFAELVPFVVRTHITTTGMPLNRKVGKCSDLQRPTFARVDDVRQKVENVPPHVRFGLHTWVGAFDGGARFGCGVFHPSPLCAMNQTLQKSQTMDTIPIGNGGTDTRLMTHHIVSPFCPVCSYLLVEAIDPNLHGEVDKLYALHYVEGLPP